MRSFPLTGVGIRFEEDVIATVVARRRGMYNFPVYDIQATDSRARKMGVSQSRLELAIDDPHHGRLRSRSSASSRGSSVAESSLQSTRGSVFQRHYLFDLKEH